MNKTSHSPHALHVCSWAHWHTSRGPEKTAAKANGGKVIVDTNSFTGGKHHYTPLMPPFVGYFMVCSCICKVFVGYFHVFSVATFDDEGIQQDSDGSSGHPIWIPSDSAIRCCVISTGWCREGLAWACLKTGNIDGHSNEKTWEERSGF